MAIIKMNYCPGRVQVRLKFLRNCPGFKNFDLATLGMAFNRLEIYSQNISKRYSEINKIFIKLLTEILETIDSLSD